MGVMAAGQSRVRWIRFLILVLALTASRNNFPLLRAHVSPPLTIPAAEGSVLSKVAKKYEGVTPSRRHLESRFSDWLQARSSDIGLASSPRLTLSGEGAALRIGAVRGEMDDKEWTAITRPQYLKLHLQASSSSSLAPPA
jgi:hypothetical protein